jgi:hypothetical protein
MCKPSLVNAKWRLERSSLVLVLVLVVDLLGEFDYEDEDEEDARFFDPVDFCNRSKAAISSENGTFSTK